MLHLLDLSLLLFGNLIYDIYAVNVIHEVSLKKNGVLLQTISVLAIKILLFLSMVNQ